MGCRYLRGLRSLDRSCLIDNLRLNITLGYRPDGLSLLHKSLHLQDNPLGHQRRDRPRYEEESSRLHA
jgi:hypothetical protein